MLEDTLVIWGGKFGLTPTAQMPLTSKIGRDHHNEVDRGTMPISRKDLNFSSIWRKALAYLETRQEGLLRDRFDLSGFQTIFVAHSRDRLEQMKRVCESISGDRFPSLFIFALIDEFKTVTRSCRKSLNQSTPRETPFILRSPFSVQKISNSKWEKIRFHGSTSRTFIMAARARICFGGT